MTENCVDLDAYRGMTAQIETDLRRERHFRDQAQWDDEQLQQTELEASLLAEPAETWPEMAARLQYLILLFADTEEAQEPQRRALIAMALEDLERLCSCEEGKP
ncbi:MAG: hypothetical protein AAF530_23770 [Pseudomonadota bacterium]